MQQAGNMKKLISCFVFLIQICLADDSKLTGSFCKTNMEDLKQAERYLDINNIIEDYHLNRLSNLGEPEITFFDISQARNYIHHHPLFKEIGLPSKAPDSNWKEYTVKMENSDFFGENMGHQTTDFTMRIRLDTEVIEERDPPFKFNKSGIPMPKIQIKQAHYNLEGSYPDEYGKEKKFKLKINFDCNGKPCESKDLIKLFEK